MGEKRRVGPAAVIAALLGAGLALNRPRLVPELSSGARTPRLAKPVSLSRASSEDVAAPEAAAVRHSAVETRTRSPRTDDENRRWRNSLAYLPPRPEGDFRSETSVFLAARAYPGGPSPASRTNDGSDIVPVNKTPRSERLLNAVNDVPAMLAPTSRRVAASSPSRTPLALGPAAPEHAEANEASAVRAPVSKSGASRPKRAGWARRMTRPFPLFQPPRRTAPTREKAAAKRRVRPLLLSKLLGRDALHPPPSSIVPPDLSALNGRKPSTRLDGSALTARSGGLDLLERIDPRRTGPACRRSAPHWDGGLLWHDGPARGVIVDEQWLWLWKEKARWWSLAEPQDAALLRHRSLWWSKRHGVWFALHEGELWSWRRFSEWDAEGLIRLTDGVELAYSADFSKVAVITPGAGAVLYDAATGTELGEWLESELPRRSPAPPEALRLPRGI